jgi:hypothetical protein
MNTKKQIINPTINGSVGISVANEAEKLNSMEQGIAKRSK